MGFNVFEIVKRPIISEKSTAIAEVASKYVFEVAAQSTKSEVKTAVEKLFNVKVQTVRTMMMHGKAKRRARGLVKKPNWKKAIVTLKEGNRIDFFPTK